MLLLLLPVAAVAAVAAAAAAAAITAAVWSAVHYHRALPGAALEYELEEGWLTDPNGMELLAGTERKEKTDTFFFQRLPFNVRDMFVCPEPVLASDRVRHNREKLKWKALLFSSAADCSAALEAEKAKLTETMMASLSQVSCNAKPCSDGANRFRCGS